MNIRWIAFGNLLQGVGIEKGVSAVKNGDDASVGLAVALFVLGFVTEIWPGRRFAKGK